MSFPSVSPDMLDYLEACHSHLMIFAATGKTVRQGTLLRYDGL
jgi:hypothetical protein